MNTLSYVSSFIIGAGILQGVFLAVILLSIGKGNKRANRILAFLLLTFSINITHSVLFADLIYKQNNPLMKINEPFQLLLGPLTFFYIRELTSPLNRFKKADIFHILPFGLYSLMILFSPKIEAWHSFLKQYSSTATVFIWSIILTHIVSYTIAAVHCSELHRKRIKECYSDIDRINLNWLKYMLCILLAVYLIYFVLLVWLIHGSNPFPHFQKVICIILSISVFGFGYRGLTQPEIFNNNLPDNEISLEKMQLESICTDENPSPKYEHSGLDAMEADEISKKLSAFMDEEKPYLNPELTLPDLASMLEIPRNRLSQVLNEKLGMNFYDFINGYRIKRVQELMADPSYQYMKILAVAFDAGFSSKATFNNFFKKYTGVTPSEYRRQLETK
ncbi:MAG: helix-turn-helix domain-containing protein [Clostridia bacterium]|nr:helix-turn-helix domain-containing protein [Clostridia bacterium]